MKVKRLISVTMAIISIFISLAFAQEHGKFSKKIGKTERFQNELQKQGLEVTPWEDAFGPIDLVCLVCNEDLTGVPSGYGNNAGAPYQTISDTQYGIRIPREIQLEPYDALVFIGKTPPPAAYFSFTGFVFSRYDGEGKERKVIFSSIGDTINPYRINTLSGKPPFDKDIMIVITADRGTDQRIRKAAKKAGIQQAMMNTMVVPSSVVKLGKNEEADTMVFLQRIFLPEDQGELDKYMSTANEWAKVFYVTYPDKHHALDPYPAPEMKVRGTGKTEVDLMPALDKLEAAILAANPGYQADKLQSGIWLDEWLDGFQRGTNLLGECRDTSYLRTEDFKLTPNPNDFLIVFGINHEQTGKATYSNFSLYHSIKELGLAGKHSRQFNGTADQYNLGQYQDKAKYLYAFKVARDCGGLPEDECLQVDKIPVSSSCFTSDCPSISLDDDLFLAFRAYVEPKTGVGPYWYEILWDRAIHFTE
jgi:hypothetical protein